MVKGHKRFFLENLANKGGQNWPHNINGDQVARSRFALEARQ
jgi:hypothetical protein